MSEETIINKVFTLFCKVWQKNDLEHIRLETSFEIVKNDLGEIDYVRLSYGDLGLSKKFIKEVIENKKKEWVDLWEEEASLVTQIGENELLKKLCKESREIAMKEVKHLDNLLWRLDGWEDINSKQQEQYKVEELRQIPLDEIIGIKGKKMGKEMMFLCPFHNEKTPSFAWERSKNLWHCFGCNEGGDVIDFVMKREKCNFITALKFLDSLGGRH